MKTVIIAGDTLDFATSVDDYPASDGWTLTYRLIPRTAGPSVIEFNASADGDEYRVQVSNGTTASWTAGEYSWFAYLSEGGSQRISVDDGEVTILPNPATATSYDRRTFARTMLDAIEAALEGKATSNQLDVISYSIGSRAVQKDKATLIPLRDKFKWEVKNEEARERIAAGLGNPRRIGIRFGRPS